MLRNRRLQSVAVMAVTFALASCDRSQALEDITPGTDVTIETSDGRMVSGRLVKVEPESVALAVDDSNRQVQVVRTAISDVRSGESVHTVATREITAPSGTALDAQLETAVASSSSRVEDPVRARLESPLVVDGVTIAPAGSMLLGEVASVRDSGRVKGRAELGLRFSRLQMDDVTYDIDTRMMRWVAEGTKRDDAAKIGIGAIAGAVVGGVTGGGKGAAVGSAIGAGGGTAVVLATKGKDVVLGSGSGLRVTLARPLTVIVPTGGNS